MKHYRKPERHEHAFFALMFVGIVVIFAVWAVQLKHMFNPDLQRAAEESVAQTKEQIEAAQAYREVVGEVSPALNQGLEDFLDASTASLLLETAKNRAAEAVAEDVVNRISAEEEAESPPTSEAVVEEDTPVQEEPVVGE